jgi:hypothetical protein
MTATIGDNGGPALDPLPALLVHLDDLMQQATDYLDGEPVTTEGQAADVELLKTSIKQVAKDIEAARVAEKKPHDDAAKAVQEKYKPHIDRAKIAADTAAKALTPWLLAEQAKRDAEAKAKREETERLVEEARLLRATAEPTDLSAKLVSEDAFKAARKAEAAVNKADRSATGLRTYWTAQVTDYGALTAYLKKNRTEEFKAMLDDFVERAKNAGARQIPGVLIKEEKRAA